MADGVAVTPADHAAVENLMRYWAEGEGATKIGWGSPGDYDRCVTKLSEHVSPHVAHGLCNHLHQRATGRPPGKA